jgi:hypothetical protein
MEENMERVKEKLSLVVSKLQTLVLEDDFPAYKTLLDKYSKALEKVNISQAKSSYTELDLDFTTRMLMEAPPKNYEQGMEILKAMDEVYQLLK